MIEDSRFRDRIAPVEMELMALEVTNLRVLSKYARNSQALGPEMGVVDEHSVSHRSFKRLTMIDPTFGDADYHLGRFSDMSLTP